MATQRVTIAKIGGVAAKYALRKLHEWAACRTVNDPHEWSNDQWPPNVRTEVDAFADRLRANSLTPPVVYFVEWVDMWSMGDIFQRELAPTGGDSPVFLCADHFEIYWYALPDSGRLEHYLLNRGPRESDEYDEYINHLLRAARAWHELIDRSVLVVLREVVGGLVTDDELSASLSVVPSWLVQDETHRR